MVMPMNKIGVILKKLHIWIGILGNNIVGFVFLNQNLTGDIFVDLGFYSPRGRSSYKTSLAVVAG